jgi:predicted glutamine amidotransferase
LRFRLADKVMSRLIFAHVRAASLGTLSLAGLDWALVRMAVVSCCVALMKSQTCARTTAGLLINEANCHPFSFGPFIWMHNGQIVGFHSIKRKLVQCIDDRLFNHVQAHVSFSPSPASPSCSLAHQRQPVRARRGAA